MPALARHTFDPLTGKAIFVTPDNPAVNGLDGVIGSLANMEGTGRFFSKGGAVETDWSEFALTSGFLPLTGGPLSGALTIGTDPGGTDLLRVGGNVTIIGDETLGGRLKLTGSLGGFGGAVRYIGVGGSVNTIYHNVPTGGGHSFGVNEVTQISISTAGVTVSGSGVTMQSIQPILGWAPGGGAAKWITYMASTSDANLYVRDAVNARMQLTYSPGVSNTAALSAFSSSVSVAGNLTITGTSGFTSFSATSATFSGAVTTVGFSSTSGANISGSPLIVTSDIVSYRSGAVNTGVIYLNQAQNRYLFFDGTQYQLANAGLTVGGAVSMGTLTATTGVFTSNLQLGSITSGATLYFGSSGTAAITYTAGANNNFLFNAPVQGPAAGYTRDRAAFLHSGAGNALIWGHANTEYRNAIGAFGSVGYPFIALYSYAGTSADVEYRSGTNTRPARLTWDINGKMMYHTGPQNGTPDTAVTWTSVFEVAQGLFSVFPNSAASGVFAIGANSYASFISAAATLELIGAASSANQLITGSVAGDICYRSQSHRHLFSANAGSSAEMSIANGGVSMAGTLTVYSSITSSAGNITLSTNGTAFINSRGHVASVMVFSSSPASSPANYEDNTIWVQI